MWGNVDKWIFDSKIYLIFVLLNVKITFYIDNKYFTH
jgi:hypothetical protein